MEIVFIIGVAQALFFCGFLLTARGNKIPNIILSIWLLLISFSLFLVYFYESGKIQNHPYLIGLDTAFPFLYMPILYFYTKWMVFKKTKFKLSDSLHLAPFFGYFIYVWITFYSEDAEYKLEFLHRIQEGNLPIDIQISNFLKVAQAAIYIVYILKLLRVHQRNITQNFSYTDNINLKWLRTITYCLSFIYSLQLLSMVSIYFGQDSPLSKMGSLAELAIVLFVFIIAFYGIKQPDIFARWNVANGFEKSEEIQSDDLANHQVTPDLPTASKYKDSNLTEKDSLNIL